MTVIMIVIKVIMIVIKVKMIVMIMNPSVCCTCKTDSTVVLHNKYYLFYRVATLLFIYT